jgi:hypothetical protein
MNDRRALRRSLILGAAYDVVLGAVIVAVGVRLLGALGQPVPDRFHFHLTLLPLFLLPALYWAAARAADPDPFRLPVLCARGGGGSLILLAVLLWPPHAAWVYLAIAAGDLVWAGVHAGLWRRP